MRQKIIKIKNEDGLVHLQRTRHLTLFYIDKKILFKDTKGNVVEPTDIELEIYNDYESGGIKVTNGWLTFLGILAIINLIGLILLITKLTR